MRASRQTRAWSLAGALIAALATAGCSQIQQLQPVAGAQISSVRIATIDVLTDNGVAVSVAPVCMAEATGYSCSGKAADGSAIQATATTVQPAGASQNVYGVPAEAQIKLVVSVGDAEIFSGEVDEVLQRNGQVQP